MTYVDYLSTIFRNHPKINLQSHPSCVVTGDYVLNFSFILTCWLSEKSYLHGQSDNVKNQKQYKTWRDATSIVLQ